MSYVDQIAGAIRARVPKSVLPDGDTSDLFRLYAVLALTIGTSVTRRDVHHAWVAWMSSKDPDHTALVPFEELDSGVAKADEPYVEAIHEVAKEIAT